MKKILVTGGTTFVSKYVAEYFVNAGYEVYVLNRNSKSQVQGVKLIEADRHAPHVRPVMLCNKCLRNLIVMNVNRNVHL